MMTETGVVVGDGRVPLYWHLPEGRTSGSLPDSRKLWEFIWEHRHEVRGVAHSHPGSGLPGPSYEDVTTFSAIELGLGRRLVWWITTEDTLMAFHWVGPDAYDYKGFIIQDTAEPAWVHELRKHSGYALDAIVAKVKALNLPEPLAPLQSWGVSREKFTEINGWDPPLGAQSLRNLHLEE